MEAAEGRTTSTVSFRAVLQSQAKDTHVAGSDDQVLYGWNNLVGPTVFSGVKPGMAIYDQEIFGPVLCLSAAADIDEAISFINDNPNGNGDSWRFSICR